LENVTNVAISNSKKNLIVNILTTINSDSQHYEKLVSLLRLQRTFLIQRDNAALLTINKQCTELIEQLHSNTHTRTDNLKKLGLNPNASNVERVIRTLGTPHRSQLAQCWNTVKSNSGLCRQLNDMNGRILASQKEIGDRLMGGTCHGGEYTHGV
jgi:flagellar biosynthesis protein FlgN